MTLMNQKAEEIGAYDTHFENASGLPTREKQYTTARDLTIILKKRPHLSADKGDHRQKAGGGHDDGGQGALSLRTPMRCSGIERYGGRKDRVYEQRAALFCRRHGHRKGHDLHRGPRLAFPRQVMEKHANARQSKRQPGTGQLDHDRSKKVRPVPAKKHKHRKAKKKVRKVAI